MFGVRGQAFPALEKCAALCYNSFIIFKGVFLMSEILPYVRSPFYYETDKMGVVHHSNYIRWFEEARIYFLAAAGYPYEKMEENGVMIPVASASCSYINAVRFGDTVLIALKIDEFNGFRLTVSYRVVDKKTGVLAATGRTTHIFTDMNMKPVRTKHSYPEIYDVFYRNIGVDFLDGMQK